MLDKLASSLSFYFLTSTTTSRQKVCPLPHPHGDFTALWLLGEAIVAKFWKGHPSQPWD